MSTERSILEIQLIRIAYQFFKLGGIPKLRRQVRGRRRGSPKC